MAPPIRVAPAASVPRSIRSIERAELLNAAFFCSYSAV
jgi:hypothetical protein